MTRWNLHSNVADVLGLGPRTAGRLLRLGVRTAGQLLAAKPSAIAERLGDARISAPMICAWQREAQLAIAAPQLAPQAARIFAAVGYDRPERIALCSPTDVLAAIERLRQQANMSWLSDEAVPGIRELSDWIAAARKAVAGAVA